MATAGDGIAEYRLCTPRRAEEPVMDRGNHFTSLSYPLQMVHLLALFLNFKTVDLLKRFLGAMGMWNQLSNSRKDKKKEEKKTRKPAESPPLPQCVLTFLVSLERFLFIGSQQTRKEHRADQREISAIPSCADEHVRVTDVVETKRSSM